MPEEFPNFIDGDQKIMVVEDRRELDRLFGALQGRNIFQVCDTEGRRGVTDKFVTLRLDAEHGVLSGDLFHDSKDSDWIMSWRSEAIYKPDPGAGPTGWDFAALCEVFFPQTQSGGKARKVVLTAGTGKSGGIPVLTGFRMALIDGGFKSYDLTLATGNPERSFRNFPTFRRVELAVQANSLFRENANYRELLNRAVLGRNGIKSLRKAMQEAKLFGTLADRDDSDRARKIKFVEAAEEGADADEIFQAYWEEVSTRPLKNSFTYRVFLSAADDEPGADLIPLGRTLGLNPTFRRQGTRQAAVIFPKEIVASYERQYDAFKFDDGPANPDFEDHMNRLAFRVTFAIMHELAHMLNLPHPWQRAVFKESGMLSEPQALSWTNYGSFYPFGAANDFVYQRIKDQEERRRKASLRSRDTLDSDLCKAEFTAQEKMHLYHAAHDRIASGGRTFVDAERPELAMQPPVSNGARTHQLELRLDGQTDIDGVPTVTAQQYLFLPPSTTYQPLTGIVRLKWVASKDDPIDADRVFRFGAGNLFLLVRQEFDFKWPYNETRATKIYEPGFALLDRRIVRPAPNLGVQKVDLTEADGTAAFCHHIYSAPLPLIPSRFFFDDFGGSTGFTMQALMISENEETIYSNQVLIRHEQNREPKPFGDQGDAVGTLLQSAMLPALADAALYYQKSDLNKVSEVKALLDILLSDPIGTLVENREDLLWLAQLRAFVRERAFFNEAFRAARTDGQPDMIRDEVSGLLKGRSGEQTLDLLTNSIMNAVESDHRTQKIARRFRDLTSKITRNFSTSEINR